MAATPDKPAAQRAAPAARPAATAARASGRWATASRSTPTSSSRRTTTASTSGRGSRTIYAHARLRLDRPAPTCAAGCAGGASTPSASPASTAAGPRSSSREELDDEYFMLRVRIDGGRLTTEQLRVIGEISERVRPRHRRHHRPAEHPAALDPHRGRPGDLAAARGRRPVHHRGLRRHPARHPRLPGRRHRRGRDHRRHAGDRRDRRAATSATRSSPTCRASSRPRSPARRCHDVVHEINDIAFVGVVHPEHGPGFDLWVGGGLSTNPKLGERLGAWVPLEEVADVWAGVVGDLPRLRLPPAAHPGPAEVPGRRLGRRRSSARCWRTSTSSAPLTDGPAPEQPAQARRDHVGVHRQKDGRFYVGVAPARRPGRRHRRSAKIADARRGARLATGCAPPPSRRWSCSTSTEDQVDSLVAGLEALDLRVDPVAVPARHDGLHRHRVLQARHRRDQGARRRARRRAGAPAAGLRRADHHQRQRLPERLRPHPDRRHRPQGPARRWTRTATRSRASRCTSAAGSGWTPASAARCAASRSPPTSCPTTSSGSCAASRRSAPRASASPQWAARADEEALS